MSADFLVPVKSTLDKLMWDLVAAIALEDPANYSTLGGLDMDDIVDTDELIKSQKPLLLWQHISLAPKPRDPLYTFEFMVGAKTSNDKGNYLLANLSMRVQNAFKVDTFLDVQDYSGDTAVPGKGYLTVVSLSQAPQVFDNVAGIRMWQAMAIGARKI